MLNKSKNNYKAILTHILLLFLSIVTAYLFEDQYRQFIRFLFKFFYPNKIQFIGKNFHLFASDSFVIVFVLFTTFIFLIIKNSPLKRRIVSVCISIVIFFLTTIISSLINSQQIISKCDTFRNKVYYLTYNEPRYDMYFIISLSMSLVSILIFSTYKAKTK